MTFIKTEPNTGRRIGATLIDYLVITAFFFWFVLTFGEPNNEGGRTVSGAPALIPMLFWFAWLVLAETFFGTTLGHEIVGLKIVSTESAKPAFAQAVKRRLCDAIEISWCFGLIAFILVKNTQYHQRLGDIWSKTFVVDKKATLLAEVFEFEKVK